MDTMAISIYRSIYLQYAPHTFRGVEMDLAQVMIQRLVLNKNNNHDIGYTKCQHTFEIVALDKGCEDSTRRCLKHSIRKIALHNAGNPFEDAVRQKPRPEQQMGIAVGIIFRRDGTKASNDDKHKRDQHRVLEILFKAREQPLFSMIAPESIRCGIWRCA
jgi:hypothetical protein